MWNVYRCPARGRVPRIAKSDLHCHSSKRVQNAKTNELDPAVGTHTTTHALALQTAIICTVDGSHTRRLFLLYIVAGRLRRPIPSWPYRLHAGAPSPPALTHPPPPNPALIYASAVRAKMFFMLVLGAALPRRTRVGDRHLRGCGDLGRQSP